MGQFLLLVVVALTVGAVVFGVTVLLTGGDSGLSPAEPDGRAVPLPGTRPLAESDVARVRFDVTTRGYRMAQVDQAMRRAAYDIGYKDELINVLEAEVDALRSGRFSDAEVLRRAREAAQAATSVGPETSAEVDQEVATINLDEDAKAAERTADSAESVDIAEPVEPADTETDRLAEPEDGSLAESEDEKPVGSSEEPPSDQPASPHPDAASGGVDGGRDQPESDSIMPSHR
jgi:DivIVA domain-containing protein